MRVLLALLFLYMLFSQSAYANCVGEGTYYEPDNGCSWAGAITEFSLAKPYAVAEVPVARNLYNRYEVTVAGAASRLGVSTGKRNDNLGSRAEEYAWRVGMTWAQLPPFIHHLVPNGLTISDAGTGGYFPRYCNLDLNHTGCGDYRASHVIAMPSEYYENSHDEFTPEFEELLLHELGHVFYYAVSGWWDENAWARARDLDNGAYVTEYAMTNEMEDFAESFTAWVLHRGFRGRLSSDTQQNLLRIRNRLTYFDVRLLHSMINDPKRS